MIGSKVGHYLITAKLGAGGMGDVFLATDTRLDRQAAIKLLPADAAENEQRRQRFLTEAKAASALNHPHVCVVYDVGETDDGNPFIAMEFVEGDSLETLARKGPVETFKVVNMSIQIADALHAAHTAGIIHRDIKPANVNVMDNGHIKVLDFGLAKRISQTFDDGTLDLQHTQDGQILGTPDYMSPEQALGKEVDHRTDIFSMGVVLYNLLTSQLPFTGSTFSEIVNKIVSSHPLAIARLNYDTPDELERITLKCLQKSPDRRYQTARDLMTDLQDLARNLEASRPGTTIYSQTSTRAADNDDFEVSDGDKIEELLKSDVLLNYASVDDRPLMDGQQGWVSQLHRNLELRVEQLSGEPVRIGKLSGKDIAKKELADHLPRVKAMVSVVSPPFVKSDICRTDVRDFWQVAEQSGGRWIDDKSRLLKVVKTAVEDQEMPAELANIFSSLTGFDFFEIDPDSGRVKAFDETFGPGLKQRFFERVYDVSHDICQILRSLGDTNQALSVDTADRRWVYLATSTSDVQEDRDRIRRELVERGHVVLPDAPLPTITSDAEAVVRECLAKCSLAVHVLGRHFGVTPEDSSESIPAMQVRLSAERDMELELQRLVWMSCVGDIADERQRDFVERVQEDPELHGRAEILEGNLNVLKKDLIRRLTPAEVLPPAAEVTSSAEAPKVYLICDPRDETDIEALEDYLFGQGLEVCLPAFDGSDVEAEALHRDNLLSCDAVLVYYGAAPKAWVDIKLRELIKATGYGREKPIQVQAVYVAPPEDHRKRRFRSHQAKVIGGLVDEPPLTELGEFVASVKAAIA